jgi:hypothetical protein
VVCVNQLNIRWPPTTPSKVDQVQVCKRFELFYRRRHCASPKLRTVDPVAEKKNFYWSLWDGDHSDAPAKKS